MRTQNSISKDLICFGLLFLIVSNALAGVICRRQCADGEYCLGSDCKDCEYGTYNSKTLHEYTSCIPWTEKAPGEHWVIKRQGTKHRDVEWMCEQGYKLIHISVGAEECQLEETVPSSGVLDFTTEKPILKVTRPNIEHSDGGLSAGQTVAIFVGGALVFLVIILIIVVIFLYRKHKLNCIQSNKDDKSVTNSVVYGTTNGLDNPPETAQELPKSCDLNSFSRYLFINLGKRCVQFFSVLKNDCTELNIDSSLHFQRSDDVITGYIGVFSEWVKKNPKINHLQCVKEAISAIHRTYILHYEEFEKLSKNAFPQEGSGDASDEDYEEASYTSPLLDQSFYKVAFYVVEELGNRCETFLLRLKHDKCFHMQGAIDFQLQEKRNDSVGAYTEVMVEWRKANPSLPHIECIKNELNDMGRHDIVRSQRFKKLTETFTED